MQHFKLWVKGSMHEVQKELTNRGISWKSCAATDKDGFWEVIVLVEVNDHVAKVMPEWYQEYPSVPFPPGTLLHYTDCPE